MSCNILERTEQGTPRILSVAEIGSHVFLTHDRILCVSVVLRLGLILYKEFVKAVRKSGGGDKSPRDTKGGKGKKSSHSDDEEEGPAKKGPTLKLTRTLTMVLTSQLPPSKKLRGAFEGFDRSGNGRVSRRDFRTALEDVKVDLQV